LDGKLLFLLSVGYLKPITKNHSVTHPSMTATFYGFPTNLVFATAHMYELPLPVVPHKAVAEVSRIGNV